MNDFSQSTPGTPAENHSFLTFISPIAFGHFLAFGLLGQIVFTFLIFHIPQTHHGNKRIPDSPGDTLMSLALCIPFVFAVVGTIGARWKPIQWLGCSTSITSSIVAIVVLGMFDLFMLMIWSFAGYC